MTERIISRKISYTSIVPKDQMYGMSLSIQIGIDSKDSLNSIQVKNVEKIIDSLNDKILIPDPKETNIDPELSTSIVKTETQFLIESGNKKYAFPKEECRILEGQQSTTAESIAYYYLSIVTTMFLDVKTIIRVCTDEKNYVEVNSFEEKS
jgi:6-pyruvoyl-tetrahydropterin synthase